MDTRTHRSLFPESLPEVRLCLCMACKKPGVTKVLDSDGRAYFACNICGVRSERFLVWDPNMVQYFNANDELVHASVGVVVQNSVGEVLLFKRVKYPFLWTFPAGHLEVGESPPLAAIRELQEETGIEVDKVEQLFEGEIRGDSCVGGADIHHWYLYHAIVDHATPSIEAEEGGEWRWVTIDDLPQDVTYPVAFFFAYEQVAKLLRRIVMHRQTPGLQ